MEICINVVPQRYKLDGFNLHGYGETNFYDCHSYYNYDDGMSHHDGCIGSVFGGIYEHNGKAGIAPAYGANVNIYNTICNDNPIGIGYLTTTNGHAPMKGFISGNILANNGNGLVVNELATVTAVGTIYANNTTDKNNTGTLNEY